jgi:hypothetical protein
MVAMGTRAPLGSPGPVPAGPEGLWLEAFLEAPSGFLRPKTGLQGRLAAPASRRFRFSRLLLSANGRLLDVTVVGTPGSLVSAHHSTVSLLPRSPRLAASDAGTNAPSQTRKRHYAPGPRGGDKRGRRVKHRSAATSDIPAPLVARSARAGLEPAPGLIRGGTHARLGLLWQTVLPHAPSAGKVRWRPLVGKSVAMTMLSLHLRIGRHLRARNHM